MGFAGNMPALLLIGPTGSGKSPLGAMLEKRTGWVHFDFSHELRSIVRGASDHDLTEEEIAYISNLLSRHEPFSDDKSHTMKKIVGSFIKKNSGAPGVILNGLPRHIKQAKDIDDLIEVKKVAVLNVDHAGRDDDAHETAPMIEHFRRSGTSIIDVIVENGTTESRIASQILEWF
ncbi:MAG: hypothetical protein WC683_11220 [bacterium]